MKLWQINLLSCFVKIERSCGTCANFNHGLETCGHPTCPRRNEEVNHGGWWRCVLWPGDKKLAKEAK